MTLVKDMANIAVYKVQAGELEEAFQINELI